MGERINQLLRYFDRHARIMALIVLAVFLAGVAWGVGDAGAIPADQIKPVFVQMFQGGVEASGVPGSTLEMVNRHILSFELILKHTLIIMIMLVVGPFSLIMNLFNGYFFGFETQAIMMMKDSGFWDVLVHYPSIVFRFSAFVLASVIGNFFFVKAAYDYRINGNVPDFFFLVKLFGLILFPLILLAALIEGYFSPLL